MTDHDQSDYARNYEFDHTSKVEQFSQTANETPAPPRIWAASRPSGGDFGGIDKGGPVFLPGPSFRPIGDGLP